MLGANRSAKGRRKFDVHPTRRPGRSHSEGMTPMSRALRFLVVPFVALSLAAVAAMAAPAADAPGFINDLLSKALSSLNDKQLSQQQRDKDFRDVLDRDFDMPRIARFVLGRYWNAADEQQRQSFQKLFEDYLVKAYGERFSQYSGEQVKITGSRSESDTVTLVSSQVLRPNGAPPAKVDWRVRKDNTGDYKIVDIDVEGVSMLLTQREEFGSVIQRNGGDVTGLNKTLEEKLASGDTSLAAPPLPQR
jgi:phospholipid transport system substrate-binding protein